jgi:hypothetical protein
MDSPYILCNGSKKNMRPLKLSVVLLLLAAQAFPQSTWTRRGPLPSSEYLYGGAWSGSQGVLVGERGTVLTSSDALSWTVRSSGTHRRLQDAAWTGSLFVAVGDSGTVVTSADGLVWTQRTTGIPYDLRAIACADGLCVVTAGWGGAMLTSPDGINWTVHAVENSPSTSLNSVVRVPAGTGRTARWVAVGSHAVVSLDGVSWTRYPTGVPSTLSGAVWNGTHIVSTTGLGFAASGDGVTWSDNRTIYPSSLFWTGTGFLGLSGGSLLSGTGTSPTNWTIQDLRRGTLSRILRMGAVTMAIGYNGLILTSTDATTWTSRSGPTSLELSSIVWADSQFTAVGGLGSVFTSPDAITWTPRASGTSFHLRKVIAAPAPGTPRRLVAVGDSGRIAVSSDGTSWSTVVAQAASGKHLLGLTWTGTLFVAVGAEGKLLTSADGVQWSVRSAGTKTLYDVAYSGTLFVAVGLDGALLTSPDGITWTARSSGTAYTLDAVAWNGTRFVVLGSFGGLLTSTDGLTWTSPPSPPNFIVTSLLWTGSRFLATGFKDNATGVDQTYAARSTDGLVWTGGRLGEDIVGSYKTLNDVAWNGSFFTAVGAGGLIVTSPDGATTRLAERVTEKPSFTVRLEGRQLSIARPDRWKGSPHVALFAPSGRRLAEKSFDAMGAAVFSVEGWPRGVYFVEARGPEGRIVRAFSLAR